MDQRTIQSGNMLSGVVVIALGIMVSPVAIGLAASYPHELWWLGAVLCVCCTLMIVGGVQSIRSAKYQERQAVAERARIDTELAQNIAIDAFKKTGQHVGDVAAAVPLSPEVLAHWTFSAEAWLQFIRLEKRKRLESCVYEGLALVIVGTPMLMLARESLFSVALGVSAVVAVLISSLRYFLTMKSYGQPLPSNTVTITRQSVLINDTLNPFRSESIRLDKIKLIEGHPDVLEFTHAWLTRKKKKTHDELRVPVPSGKREEAKQVIQKLINPIAR